MSVDPVRVWYLRTAGSALGDTLVWTLAPVYFVTVVGMSPLQLVLVGTFMELTVFVCEVRRESSPISSAASSRS